MFRRGLARPKSCPKNGDVPNSPFLSIGSHGAHRQAQFQNIDGGFVPWVPSAPELCMTVRQWPERLGHWAHQLLDRRGMPHAGSRPRQQCRPSPQGAEEEDAARRRLPQDEAPQALRKTLGEKSPGEAIRRARKLARKKLQCEGLPPMKPRAILGAAG